MRSPIPFRELAMFLKLVLKNCPSINRNPDDNTVEMMPKSRTHGAKEAPQRCSFLCNSLVNNFPQQCIYTGSDPKFYKQGQQ
jgi:hypothetical protein